MYQQRMLLKLRKPFLKYTLNKYHVHWLSSFKHLKLPISIKIPVTIWQIGYINMTAISPFDFMNYFFAKLVVAWLYIYRIAMYVNVSRYLVKTCKRVTLNCYMLILIIFEIGISIPLFVFSIAGSGNLFEIEYLVILTCF